MPDVDDFDFRRQLAEESRWSAADHAPGEVADKVVDEFNRRWPIGTIVHAYPGTRDGHPMLTRTRTEAWLLGGHTPVVSVERYAGGIALTHIDVVVPRDPEPVPCPECDGDLKVPVGWGRGKRTETCPKCDGQGAVEVDQL